MNPTPRLVRALGRWLRFAGLVAITSGAAGVWGFAAPVAQTPVPEADLTSAPYKFVGYVRTGFDAPDPAVRGSGFVVGGRVVLSAAHVFYNFDRLGWNRATWYWQPAPAPSTFDSYSRMIAPRTYRVLAGYAAAVNRAMNGASAFDMFNRDTLALLFYQRVDENGISPLAYDSVAGSGTFSLVGYPAEIGGTTTTWGQMYSHGAGVSATFTREDPANDYLGNPMVLFQTADLLSGGGQSGGPLFRQMDGGWKAVGVTVARRNDYSAFIVRGLDSAAETLITTSNADTQAGTVGEIDHGWADTGMQAPPVLRADGSLVAGTRTSYGTMLRAFDRTGTELWRREEKDFSPMQIVETPDGRIVCLNVGRLTAYQGATGKPLWNAFPYPASSIAVGARGELYVTGSQLTVVSPFGQTERVIQHTAFALGQNVPSAIGPNNELYVMNDSSLVAFSAAGEKLWQAGFKSDDGQTVWASSRSSVAVGPTGRIFVRTDSDLRAYDPNGALLWRIADAPVTVLDRAIHILPDGRLLTLRTGAAVLMSADGAELRSTPVDTRVTSLAMDAQETLYVSDGTSVQAISDRSELNWTNTHTGGRLYLGPGNQLCVQDTHRSQLNVILTNAGAAPGLWQAGGGPDQGRRVAYPAPIAPRIVTPPAPVAVAEGYRLELSVLADGSFPLTYEWRRDGKIVPDAFGGQLVIPYAAATDAGNYTVTVRNRAGTVTSAPVAVAVNVAKFGDLVWSTPLHLVGRPAIGPDGTAYAIFLPKYGSSSDFGTVALGAFDKGGNELWRTEIGASTYRSGNPLVDDDGTIFVPSDGTITAISPAGAIRWTKNLGAVNQTPCLALGTGKVIYAVVNDGGAAMLARYRTDGARDWSVDLTAFGAEYSQPRVRRDGSVVVPPMVLVSPTGGVTLLKKLRNDGVSVIGPNDEIAGYVSSDGYGLPRVEIFDGTGKLLSQTGAQMGSPALLTGSGRLVDATGTSLRFFGAGTTALPAVSFNRAALADLGQERLLTLRTDGLLQVWARSSAVTQSATLPADLGTNFVLSDDGVLIGGYTLQAFRIGARAANSPWPLPGADARQTWRAPATFEWQVSAPGSVAIASANALYAGYSATLRAEADGVGPLSYQWQRDGVDLADETASTLSFANPTAQNSGRYRVIVSNAAGTVYSPEFDAQFAPPSLAPAGFYAAWMRDRTSGQVTGSYAALVQADRMIAFIMTRSGSGEATAYSTRLGADGTFPAGFYLGAATLRFADGRIDFGSDVTVEPIDTSTAQAPSGLPVGFYRGGAADGAGRRAYAAVLPDGRIWWAYNYFNDNGWGAEVSFPAGKRSVAGTVPWSGGTMDYTLTGTPDGVLRLTRTTTDNDQFLPPLGMVWSGRAKTERLVNLSTRGWVSPAWPPLIAGFVMNGHRQLLVRGVGPTLAQLGLPANNVLAHPQLHLSSGTGAPLAVVKRWADATDRADLRDAARRVGAFALAEGSDDAALLRRFTDPLYTTQLDGTDGGAGIALIEIYDAEADAPGSLLNLSARGYAGGGDNVLIGGFVVTGSAPKTLLIRAIGPGIATVTGSVSFALVAQPRLRLFDAGSHQIAYNKIWWTGDQGHVAAVSRQVGAFAPDTYDSAVLVTLEPGVYSAIVDADGSTAGVALLELYDVP